MTDIPDEKPELETPPEPTPEPKPETPPTPNPPSDDGEKVPKWGEELSNKVEGILEALKPPMPPDGEEVADANPVRKPWHKRGLFGGES